MTRPWSLCEPTRGKLRGVEHEFYVWEVFFAPLKPAAVIHRPGDSHFLDALEEHFVGGSSPYNPMKKTVEISLLHRFLVSVEIS